MNPVQRLFSNTVLAFAGPALMRVSAAVLFVFISRQLGPEDAGIYTLGVTYYTIIVALSTFGLHELLVREVAPRRNESGRYLTNYLLIRLLVTGLLYAGLLILLRYVLPYSEEAKIVISIMALGAFAEAIFGLCHSLFAANERFVVPTVGALINSVVALGVGYWLLMAKGSIVNVAWFRPIADTAGILVFPFALVRLFRQIPQTARTRPNWSFIRTQLRYTPGFILIGVFSILNYQVDTFIISLLLTEADLGYYGVAQTLVTAFLLIPAAIRITLYPIMARYRQEDEKQLFQIYRKSGQYLLMLGLPIVVGITLLAEPIILLIFGSDFLPAVPVLQIMIWEVVVIVLSVPVARMLLVYNYQSTAGWMRGFIMLVSIVLNLSLIPLLGIVGAAITRVLAALLFFVIIYLFVQMKILHGKRIHLHPGLIMATLIMALVVWQMRDLPLYIPVIVGAVVYGAAIFMLGVFSTEDRYYLRQLFEARRS
jgi:O-antigen/teichoic acid export membrane protein